MPKKSAAVKKIKPPLLRVSGVSMQAGETYILRNISFTQIPQQKIAIAGETGSGKTSLLKVIAGLMDPDEGEVIFENEKVMGPEDRLVPGHPHIAYLSQYFELQKFLKVEQVLTYANTLSQKQANNIFTICEIKHLLQRKTDELSGGEKQRIALARCLIKAPRLLLLDEPYSHLDIIHKNTLKAVVQKITDKLKITCIMVSHDPLDTLSWADTFLIMKDGRIIQHGKPDEIYLNPVNEYVAGLFGKFNVISNALVKTWKLKTSIVRPEHLKIVAKPNTRTKKGKITGVQFFGNYYEVEVQILKQLLTVRTFAGNYRVGEVVYVLNNR